MTFADDYQQWLADAAEQMAMTGNLYLAPSEDGLPTVVKAACYVPVSFEQAMDAGLVTEEEARARGWEPTVYRPTAWHRRLRYRIWRWRDAAALKLYRLVAGHDVEAPDE